VPFLCSKRAHRVRAGVVSLAILGVAAPLRAQPSSTLVRARACWDRGEFDIAETLYNEAIERGGLERAELLDAYVRLGASRAVMGKRDMALAAFRKAAFVEPKFATPPEAGKKVAALADKARREEEKIGSIQLRVSAPSTAPAAQTFRVETTLDATHAAVIAKIGLDVREPVSGAEHRATAPAATDVVFDVPGRLAVSESTLVVRAFALDAHENRLAVAEQRVRVEAAPAGASTRIAAPAVALRPVPPPTDADKGTGGFWSSPWPYVLGGAALAAGGAALWIGTRPSEDVSLGTVRVTAR